MKGKFEELMRILSDEGKDKEEAEESRVDLPEQTSNELTTDYLRAQIERLKEEIEGLKQDRKQRKIFSYVIFAFMCLYMAASLAAVYLSGRGFIILSDGVLIALLTTSLANVIGVFNFVAKYLFNPKK